MPPAGLEARLTGVASTQDTAGQLKVRICNLGSNFDGASLTWTYLIIR